MTSISRALDRARAGRLIGATAVMVVAGGVAMATGAIPNPQTGEVHLCYQADDAAKRGGSDVSIIDDQTTRRRKGCTSERASWSSIGRAPKAMPARQALTARTAPRALPARLEHREPPARTGSTARTAPRALPERRGQREPRAGMAPSALPARQGQALRST